VISTTFLATALMSLGLPPFDPDTFVEALFGGGA